MQALLSCFVISPMCDLGAALQLMLPHQQTTLLWKVPKTAAAAVMALGFTAGPACAGSWARCRARRRWRRA